MTFRLIVFPFLAFSLSAFGQVGNNQISNRLRLSLDNGSVHSTTAQATVEWKCINKALTNKCLVYHNDQWFSFKVPQSGNYFLNLSAQQCKGEKGIQLIIIEGNPCEINTYKILECIPQIRLEDAFVKLDSLKPNTEYLVNVDGFLGDFCTFDIGLSSKPKGLPRQQLEEDTVVAQWELKQRLVIVNWQLDDSLSRRLQAFHIYRKDKGPRATLMAQVSLQSNAYGAFLKDYSWKDTLKNHGTYRYQIIGIREIDDYPVLLSEKEVNYYEARKPVFNPTAKMGIVPLRYAENTRFSIVIYDQQSQEQLAKSKGDFDPAKDKEFAIDFGEWIDKNHRQFMVLVMDEYTQAAREFYFYWDGVKVVRE